jgi:hypothetical protein
MLRLRFSSFLIIPTTSSSVINILPLVCTPLSCSFSTSTTSHVVGGKHAMHIKPSRFPRKTRRKRQFDVYYSPKPTSPWYQIVEEALKHPGWSEKRGVEIEDLELDTVDPSLIVDEESAENIKFQKALKEAREKRKEKRNTKEAQVN